MMDSSGCISRQTDSANCIPRIYNEKPSGENNCVNIEYVASAVFEPTSLIVRLDGIVLDPSQYLISPDNMTITLVIDPTDVKALHAPLDSEECLRIDYNTPGTVSDDACITSL